MNKKIKTFLAILLLVPCFFVFVACNMFQAKSAYDIAVDNGFVGTEQEWLDSLKQGKSAYEIAVENGFVGSEVEWLESLKGSKGDAGDDGMQNTISKNVLSVVSIKSNFVNQTPFGTSSATSAGAGVIIDLDKQNGNAYIITNYHVVYYKGISTDINVFLYGMEYVQKAISATYVGGSLTNDIAVLKIENNDILKQSKATAAEFDVDQITVGQQVVAIGNPAGDGIAATKGIVSVDSENISLTLADNATTGSLRVMRIDAAVNSGNSGGGLFDSNGKLVGIVNAKVQSTKIENIAYAIPSSVVYGVYKNLVSQQNVYGNAKIKYCALGVGVDITDSWAEYDSSSKTTVIKQKVRISSVEYGSVAYGKLKAGDVLVSINIDGVEKPLYRPYMIGDYMLGFKQGEQVKITFVRDGVTNVATILLNQTPQTIE